MPAVPGEGPPWDFFANEEKERGRIKKNNRFFFLLALFLMGPYKPLMRAGEQADFGGTGSLAPGMAASRQARGGRETSFKVTQDPRRARDQGPRPSDSSFPSFLTTSAAWLRQ